MEVYLNYNKQRTVTEDTTDPDVLYSGYLEEESNYSNLELSKVKKGYEYDSLYVPDTLTGSVFYCYALLSNGSTFNWHTNASIELLFVCKSSVDAHTAHALLNKVRSTTTVSIDGKDIPIYISTSMFDKVESVHLSNGFL